ncbi:MAG TPA: crosslink repair DNA glycosylase YcaQ family protein, partial [Candidatus Limnocylindrales bacterium]|nr:crosslink repair DNA glycosylase YcaQ family protein [Candidatus Limnocylindrales bacterium]
TRPRPRAVTFVGGFDPLLVARGIRRQFLPDQFLHRVSRTAGWISPSVLVGGVVAAVWDSRVAGSKLVITVDPFEPVPPALRSAIAGAAERVGDTQGLPVEVEFGRVFTAPPRRLRIEPQHA